MFLTGTSNPDSGIIGIKFYIRGKPWVVSIDDKLFFTSSGSTKTLKFAQESATDKVMWAPILEKAWAKIKGNYDQTDGGFNVSGLRSLTGAPVFRYLTSAIGSSSGPTQATAFATLQAANTAKYLIGSATDGSSDSNRNACGIATAHAYSILETFQMTDGGTTHDMLLMKNPWGTTDYNSTWNYADSNWNTNLKSQVPWGIDPTTSNTDGIFVMPMSKFADSTCILSYEIAHTRDSEGYKAAWYDAEGMDEAYHEYFVTVPANDGALYFTVESYY